MNEQVINSMFALIRKVVGGADTSEKIKENITPEILPQLYVLSKAHDMAHIVAQGLADLELLGEDEISQKFQKQHMLAVYRYQKMNYELEQICQTLEDTKIPFIPLKGSVIRKYYPEPWMRTSCDIDILVHKNDLEKATTLLMDKMDYKCDFISPHDVSMYSPSSMHIELHYELIEDKLIGKADSLLQQVWDYSTLEVGATSKYRMSNDYFYFYHLAHMAKHMISGGCGIRSFLDLHIMNHSKEYGQLQGCDLLRQGQLMQFATEANKLSEYWFGNEIQIDVMGKTLQKYILQSGVYGTQTNAVAINQAFAKDTSSNKKLIKRIWKPYEEIKYWYPFLINHKWAMPFFQFKRWLQIIFGGTVKRILTNKKMAKNINQTDILELDQMLNALGLH